MDTNHHLKLQDSLNIISPAPPPPPSPMKKTIKSRRTVIRKKWIYEKCRVASFDNFDDACRHEEDCTYSFEESKCISATTSSFFSTPIAALRILKSYVLRVRLLNQSLKMIPALLFNTKSQL